MMIKSRFGCCSVGRRLSQSFERMAPRLRKSPDGGENEIRQIHSYPPTLPLCLIFVLFVTLSASSLLLPLRESLTYDEAFYYQSGEAILAGKASELGRDNIMPIMALYPLLTRAVAAFNLSQRPTDGPTYIQNVYLAKATTILVSMLLASFVLLWSHELYGPHAGLLAVTLYLLDPNIIAHSKVVHQNVFEAAAIFISTYYFWRLLKFGGWINFTASIVTFGIAQITRITALYLAPIYLILAFLYYIGPLMRLVKARDYRGIALGFIRASGYAFILLASMALIINLGFSFEKTLLNFDTYEFQSRSFNQLQSRPVLKHLPVPLPHAYMIDLDYGKYKQETGAGSGRPYLMGRLASWNSHFGHYYLIALLYKVPIATQLIIFMAVLTLSYRKGWRRFSENEAFLLVPPVVFLAVMSVTNAQLGIRYVLMIFPFLFVLAGRVAACWPELSCRRRTFVGGLVLYLLLSNLSYYPHYLSYFNELLTDRKMGYAILADSNLDWGQNKYYLEEYLRGHPEVLYIDCRWDGKVETAGNQLTDRTDPIRIVVGVNRVVGILYPDPPFFKWLRENKQPLDHVAYSYLVFELGSKDQPDLLTLVNAKMCY